MRIVTIRTPSLLVLLGFALIASNNTIIPLPSGALNARSFSASSSPPLNESVPVPLPFTISTVSYGYPLAAPGPQTAMVLCVEFTNQNHTKGRNEIQDTVFNRVSQYFREVSYGKISLTGAVSRWYQMNKTMGAYGRDSALNIDDPDGDGAPDSWTLIQEAIYAADSEIDFSQYTYLILLHAGLGQETSNNPNDIWSCAYLMGIWFRTHDGISYSKAMIVPELESQGADTVGVVAHEFAHLLGLPDLYDPYRRSDYCGRWELMGKGLWNGNPPSSSPAHILAWGKIKLGWISEGQVAVVPTGVVRNITLSPLETNGTTMVVKIPITDKSYYLMELRQRIGFDIGLPDSGLLLTYIDGDIMGQGSVRVVDANALTATLDDAAFKPGKTFTDTATKLFFSVLGTSEQNYRIVVNRIGPAPDVAATKFELTPYPARSGRMTTLTFQITNQGTMSASNFTVQVYLDTNLIYTGSMVLEAGQSRFIYVNWNATVGRHVVRCLIDSAGQLNDINRLNNDMIREFLVGSILSIRLPWSGGSVKVNGTTYTANGTYAIEIPVLSAIQTVEVLAERPLQSGARLVFSRWSDGDTANPRIYRTTGDATLSAEYKTQYRLTIIPGRGETSGDGWYDENTGATAKATSPSLTSGGKTRLVFSHWSGDYTSNLTTVQLTMSRSYNLTASWITEHYLTVTSPVGIFAEQGWHREGRTVQVKAVSPIDQGNRTRRVFISWSGDLTSESTEITVSINGPKAIVANWKTEYELCVLSEYGRPSGSGWIASGETARFSVETTINAAEGVRYVFIKWTGDHESASSDSSVVMNGPRTITANWKTQYLIRLSVSGLPNGSTVALRLNQQWWNGSMPFSFSEWMDAGSNMTIQALPKVQAGPDQYVLEGFRDSEGKAFVLPCLASAPQSLEARYLRKPKGLLHILESAYDQEATAQLGLLEIVRERYLTSTFAANHWSDIFGRIFDSLLPDISTTMADNSVLKMFLRVLLYPILQILPLSASAYFMIGSGSDLAFFGAGFIASLLVGIAYLLPLLLPLLLVMRRRRPNFGKSTPKYAAIALMISIELIVLGEITQAPITTTAGTFIFLALSACFSAMTMALAVHCLIRQIRSYRIKGKNAGSPKSLMGLRPNVSTARGVSP